MIDIRQLGAGNVGTQKTRSEKTRKKSATDATSSSAASSEDDSVSLTSKASLIQGLISQMMSAPVVDMDRVSPVKEKIDEGRYEIEYERVANKMLDFEEDYYKL